MPRARESTLRETAASGGLQALEVGFVLVLLVVVLVWSYWPTINGLIYDWQNDANYSAGQLVPLAALYLLWHKRRALAKCRVAPCGWGIAVILLAQAGWAFGLLFYFKSAERYSLALTVAGIVLLVGGRQVFHAVRWILLFLFLMVPLPGRIHNLISGPLQDLAIRGAVFVLELAGVAAAREGNVIMLNGAVPVAVAEACSGLRMLTAFVIVAAVLAYVVSRPRWQKLVLIISSIPVAILCNIVRVVVTALLFQAAGSEMAERFFHDFAGLTMMPVAVLLLLGELWIMSRLIVEDQETRVVATL
ncbi:MAG: exosortase/archaeosortase family protein [Phycisphaerales bacterium]|nr:MAG: exosortase/archaeosortase family protein [Phycisphaerales bacterium]